MNVPMSETPLHAFVALETAYWICLIVGGGLLVISTVAGADSGLDTDLDVDTHHAHAASLASWFSMQFVVFFVAVFGLLGVVFTHMTDVASGVTAGISVVGALVVGQCAHQVLRRIRMGSGDSTPRHEDYINRTARVTVRIAGDSRGEVALRVGRSDKYVAAKAKRPDDVFQPGTQVGVIAYQDGVVQVVSQQEYEFVSAQSEVTASRGE